MTITSDATPDPVYPFSAQGLTAENGSSALANLFDGISDDGNKTGVFTYSQEDLKNEKLAIDYDFGKPVKLTGIDMYANYGNDQGIKKFKVALWDDATQSWQRLKENGTANDKVFTLNWQTQSDTIEKQSVSFTGTTVSGQHAARAKAGDDSGYITSKVRIIPTDIGNTWGHLAMSEIAFEQSPLALQSLTVTPPTKRDYVLGEPLDTTGMVVTGNYEGGVTADVTASAQLNGYDANTVGKQTITVTVGEQHTTFTVTVSADKTALRALIAKAALLNQRDYTADSWKPFAEALATARALAADATASASDVANAQGALQKALDGLRNVSNIPPSDEPSKDNSSVGDSIDSNPAPQAGIGQTGASVMSVALLCAVLVIVAGVARISRRHV